MVKPYRKGYMGERELVYKLHERGYMVIRAPRSGRISLPSPDVIAVKDGKVIVVECKTRNAAFTVEEEQLKELSEWSEKGGAKAYVAWKLPRKEWIFLNLRDVIDNNGNVGKRFAIERGFGFDKI